jgi:hypothetical protein
MISSLNPKEHRMSQKPISFLAFTLSLSLFVFGVLSAEAIVYSKRSWKLENNPDAFAHDVAMACLTSKSSNISTSGTEITIQDDKACGDDLQALSLEWDKNPTVPMMSINTIRRDRQHMKATLSEKFSEKFKDSKPEELTILPKNHCPCVILRGTRAKEAKTFLFEQLGGAKQGITPLKFQLHPKPSASLSP